MCDRRASRGARISIQTTSGTVARMRALAAWAGSSLQILLAQKRAPLAQSCLLVVVRVAPFTRHHLADTLGGARVCGFASLHAS